MARKPISKIGLDPGVVCLLNARKVLTAKDALGLTELELMELLDMPLENFNGVLSRITESVCPPFKTVLSILNERSQNEVAMGHLSTQLHFLDDALCGGIPFGVITELVGPAGIGKTQLCLMLSIQAVIPVDSGGLGGSVVYIDTERKFCSTRMVEIGRCKYPEFFQDEDNVHQLAARIIILTPTSATELVERFRIIIIEHRVKLLIIDSMATLLEGDNEIEMIERQELLGQQASLLKYLSESFRMAVVVTNHVRTSGIFEGAADVEAALQTNEVESELLAALGTKWAHAVNIRLVLELREGRRCIRIAKCPMSAAIAIPYVVTASGIEMDGNEALQVNEQDVMAIYRNYEHDPDEEIVRSDLVEYCLERRIRAR